jgi:hypothetical protein
MSGINGLGHRRKAPILQEAPRMPHYRWTGFYAYQNRNGITWHIIATDDSGGMTVADEIPDQHVAEWMASTLTAALPPEQRNTDTGDDE